MRSGEPILRSKRAHKRHASPGVSASASQEREASSSIAAGAYALDYLFVNYKIYYTGNTLHRLRGIFGQNGSKGFRKNVGVAFRNDQWRAEFEDIVKWAVCSGEHAAFAKAIYHVCGLCCGRGTRD